MLITKCSPQKKKTISHIKRALMKRRGALRLEINTYFQQFLEFFHKQLCIFTLYLHLLSLCVVSHSYGKPVPFLQDKLTPRSGSHRRCATFEFYRHAINGTSICQLVQLLTKNLTPLIAISAGMT